MIEFHQIPPNRESIPPVDRTTGRLYDTRIIHARDNGIRAPKRCFARAVAMRLRHVTAPLRHLVWDVLPGDATASRSGGREIEA